MALTTDQPNLTVNFDANEDVLYVSVGSPAPGYADEAPDGVLLRRSANEDRPIGVTAFDFRANWIGRRAAFYSLVAEYLRIPPRIVERSIEAAI
jgi:hypothetical protein